MNALNNEVLGDALIALGKRIRSGRCELSQEQMELIFAQVERSLDVPVSKEQACAVLGVSRSTFDAKVLAGELPRGRKRKGFKELVWYKRELYDYGKER